MIQKYDDFEIDDSFSRIDFKRVGAWLSETYWAKGRSLETIVRSSKGSSLVIGAFSKQTQVAYLRVVSDQTTFAWVCDVYVDEPHRRLGLATAMLRFALDHHEHRGVRRWVLATRDAHDVYRPLGFETLTEPERWMSLNPPRDADQGVAR